MGEENVNQTATLGAQDGAEATSDVNKAGQETNTGKTGRTYTEDEFQSEVDKRVRQSLNSAKEKWNTELLDRVNAAKDEGARLARMTAEERAKEEQKKQQKAFEDERAKYMRDKLEFETTKQLAELKLPVSFAGMLAGSDAETTKANIESFQKEWNTAVQSEIENKLKGSTPKSGGGGTEDAWLANLRKGAGLN